MLKHMKEWPAIALIALVGLVSAACSTTVMQRPLVKGPGNLFYMQLGTKIYICALEGENLNCKRELKINVDREYHKKPGYFKN